jgi:hypothetical protein
MNDRTIKMLLVTVAVLLVAVLIRPALVAPAARAQAPTAQPAGQSAITANNNLIYILQGNQLSVYYVDIGHPLEALKLLGDEKEREEFAQNAHKNAKLRFLLRQDISQVPADAAKAR